MKTQNYLTRNIRLYYGAQFLVGLRFMAPVWVLFFRHYLSLPEIALLEALGLMITTILELPSGVFADLFGRKTSVVLGYIICGIGFIIIGLADSFAGFLLGYVINGIGSSFVSGAETALLFDTLKDHQKEQQYPTYSGRGVGIFRSAIIVAMLVGPFLYKIFIGLPYIAIGVTAVIAGCVYLFVKEPFIDTEKFTARTYFSRMRLGIHEAFKDEYTKKLSIYFLTIASIELILLWFYYAMYITWLGYSENTIGWIYAAIAGTRLIVSLYSQQIEKLVGDKNLFLGLPVILGLSLIFGGIKNIYVGSILLFIHYSLFTLRYTLLDKYTNLRFESKYRASAISTLNMGVSLVYILVISVFGLYIPFENIGFVFILLGIVLLVIGLPLGYSLVRLRK